MADLFNHRLNNDYYNFKVVLSNANQKSQIISPTAIKSMVIEDFFYNFFHKGYIVIDNRFDAVERSVNETLDTSNKKRGPSFIFLGDARDYISFEIFPTGDDGSLVKKDIAQHTRIYFEASIYAIEEIATETPDVKYKKLYFWDRYYQTMLEKNVYWSTADIVENRVFDQEADTRVLAQSEEFADTIAELKQIRVKNIINFDDTLRGIPTGEAIKKFISAVFPANGPYPAAFPSASFATDGGYTLDPAIRENDPTWDLGATTAFFSTPAKYKAIDSLVFLLNRHVSNADNNFDQAFLRIDRATRVFTFRPLINYFKAAYTEGSSRTDDTGGPLYIETIMLGGFGFPDASDMKYSSVADYTPTKGTIQLLQIGTTTNYSLEPSLGIETQRKFTPRQVHSHSMAGKQFQIDIEKNNMYNTMLTYQQNYVDSIKSRQWSSIVPGIDRVDNVNVEHIFSTVDDDEQNRITTGRNFALYNSIFANNQVKLRLPGATIRQAGKFIGLDRSGSSPANEYDQKLLGVYFITEVKHVFEGNNYYNEITCIKTYTGLPIYKGQIGPGNENINKQVIP
jgi:hypothetical protein